MVLVNIEGKNLMGYGEKRLDFSNSCAVVD
jgi:hypothetical protein